MEAFYQTQPERLFNSLDKPPML